MKRVWLLSLSVLLLLTCVASARTKKEKTPPPPPPPEPSGRYDLKKVKIKAVMLAFVQSNTPDGESLRDVNILIDSMAYEGTGSIPLSYKSFYLKDPGTGSYFQARGTNNRDLTGEVSVSAMDGELPYFKLFFLVPDTFRPDKIYLRIGDDQNAYELSY